MPGLIQKGSEGAETGYVVAELKRRRRDRPGRGAEPMLEVAVRLAEDRMAIAGAAYRPDSSAVDEPEQSFDISDILTM